MLASPSRRQYGRCGSIRRRPSVSLLEWSRGLLLPVVADYSMAAAGRRRNVRGPAVQEGRTRLGLPDRQRVADGDLAALDHLGVDAHQVVAEAVLQRADDVE